MGRPLQYDHRGAIVVNDRYKPNVGPTENFHRHPPEPAGPREYLISTLDHDGVYAGVGCHCCDRGPHRRHLWSGEDVQPGLCLVYHWRYTALLCLEHRVEWALELVILRMFQAIGGGLLMANSAAIITDAFPSDQLGFALGINMVAAIVGSFLGILVGGLLSLLGWRWVFIATIPVGSFGTIWAYLKLKDIGIRIKARIDWQVTSLSRAAWACYWLVSPTESSRMGHLFLAGATLLSSGLSWEV